MILQDQAPFEQQKQNALQKLRKAAQKQEVDIQILPLLNTINASDHYYTTSSCSGRIVLLELPTIGDKKNARFLGKWHNQIRLDDLQKALDHRDKNTPQLLWFLAQSPIIHVVADTLTSGDLLIKTALSCGFKNSGFRSIHKKIIIELQSTERLDTPLAENEHFLWDEHYLSLLIKNANLLYNRSNAKLIKLHRKLKR